MEINLIVFFLLHPTCSCERGLTDKNEVHELNKKTFSTIFNDVVIVGGWMGGRKNSIYFIKKINLKFQQTTHS